MIGKTFLKKLTPNQKKSLGKIVAFIDATMKEMQKEADLPPLGGDDERNQQYSAILNKELDMPESVSKEGVYIIANVLCPSYDGCHGRTDVMGDKMPGYHKTGCLNICLSNYQGTILLLQCVARWT